MAKLQSKHMFYKRGFIQKFFVMEEKELIMQITLGQRVYKFG